MKCRSILFLLRLVRCPCFRPTCWHWVPLLQCQRTAWRARPCSMTFGCHTSRNWEKPLWSARKTPARTGSVSISSPSYSTPCMRYKNGAENRKRHLTTSDGYKLPVNGNHTWNSASFYQDFFTWVLIIVHLLSHCTEEERHQTVLQRRLLAVNFILLYII